MQRITIASSIKINPTPIVLLNNNSFLVSQISFFLNQDQIIVIESPINGRTQKFATIVTIDNIRHIFINKH